MIWPVESWQIDETAKADAPPPEGSTATMKWCVLLPEPMMSTGMRARVRLRNASTSDDGNARTDPSALTPIDSLSNMACEAS